ncbi:hypothetical protein HDU97_009940 [Phlyctochytrium planicorne]|nr:hypothetical protein HDU97_009940 [Phlyctochytrium planicorne]
MTSSDQKTASSATKITKRSKKTSSPTPTSSNAVATSPAAATPQVGVENGGFFVSLNVMALRLCMLAFWIARK